MTMHAPSRGLTVQVQCAGTVAVERFLDEAWPSLFSMTSQRTPYQSPGWLRSWVRHTEPHEEPYVLAVWDTVGLQAALVLVRSPLPDGRSWVAPLSSPAAESICLTGPGAGDAAVAAAVGSYLKQLACKNVRIHLPDVPSDTALGRHLLEVWNTSAVVEYATVPVPWPKAALSRSTRRNHRRRLTAWTALTDQGHQVSFRRSSDLPQVLTDYSSLARLHELRSAGRPAADPSLASRPGQAWLEVIARCAGAVWTAVLSMDQEVVAVQMCLGEAQTAHSVLTAIHPDYRVLAPGHVLLQLLLDDLAVDGYEQLVLGRTVPAQRAYKQQYGAIWNRTLTFDSHGW